MISSCVTVAATPVRTAWVRRTGVAAADDHRVFVLRGDLVLDLLAERDAVRLRQKVHRLVHTAEVAPWDREVAGNGRADGQHHRVETLGELGARRLATDIDSGTEDRSLTLHLVEPSVEVALLHLELGDAVAQEPTNPVGTLVDGHGVPGTGQLLRNGQAGRTGPDDRDRLAGQPLGRLRAHVPRVPGFVDDRDLDVLDRHRRLVDPEHARGLTRSRAEPAGELREVVRRVQSLDRALPVVAPDQVVPLRDQVAERAALVAERDAAVHTASGLLGDDRQVHPTHVVGVDLVPVLNTLLDGTSVGDLTVGGQKAFRVSHGEPPSSRWQLRPRSDRPPLRTPSPRAPCGSRWASPR